MGTSKNHICLNVGGFGAAILLSYILILWFVRFFLTPFTVFYLCRTVKCFLPNLSLRTSLFSSIQPFMILPLFSSTRASSNLLNTLSIFTTLSLIQLRGILLSFLSLILNCLMFWQFQSKIWIAPHFSSPLHPSFMFKLYLQQTLPPLFPSLCVLDVISPGCVQSRGNRANTLYINQLVQLNYVH